MIRTATCCCAKTSIKVQGDPVVNGICSCNDCKRRTGSAFGWSAYFEDDQVLQHTGTPGVYEVAVSAPQQRFFCTHCGSTLYWTTAAFPSRTGVAGGSFIEAPLPQPKASFRHARRCAWLGLPSAWETYD